MPFTVEDFHDLVRLLDERPQWRAEMRRVVLSDEYLAVPEQVAELRREVAELRRMADARWPDSRAGRRRPDVAACDA